MKKAKRTAKDQFMDDSIFEKLTPEELYEGLVQCKQNAEAHRTCARAMADRELYGLANSHLILGVEEAIKAMILLNKYLKTPLPIESIKPYFRNHPKKHAQGLKMMVDVAENRLIPDLTILLDNFVSVIQKRTTVSEALKTVLPMIRPLDNLDEWWSNANDQKNNGFYVDFVNGKWQPPTLITREQYKESEAHIIHIFGLLDFSKYLDRDSLKLFPDNL